jgi:hypothetical protein
MEICWMIKSIKRTEKLRKVNLRDSLSYWNSSKKHRPMKLWKKLLTAWNMIRGTTMIYRLQSH